MTTIRMGHRVKDRVTGFEGIVTSRHEYLNGCLRFGVQPPAKDDGKVPESYSFDEPQLEDLGPAPGLGSLVEKAPSTAPAAATGGPRDDPTRAARSDGGR